MNGEPVGDILVVGEALVDIVQPSPGPDASAAHEHPGGSPANVALGLARLGRSCRLLTRIGTDERGRAIREHLNASGVPLVAGSITERRTSTATARLDPAGVARYEFDLDWSLPTDVDLGHPTALHTGSIAALLPPGDARVRELITTLRERSVISYDPNARPALMGAPDLARLRMQELISWCDVVKVSDEDLAWLAPGADPVQVARSWLNLGPALVVLTLGGHGALAVLAGGTVQVPAPRIEVVDTVGAGDALMAGLLDALDRGDLLTVARRDQLRSCRPEDLRAILEHAVDVAAYTCTQSGANPPTAAQLRAWRAGREPSRDRPEAGLT